MTDIKLTELSIVDSVNKDDLVYGVVSGVSRAIPAELFFGASAYEVAVANGFTGTVQEWLDSLAAESIKAEEFRDQAQAAASEAEASATSASDSATAAGQSATLADQRATAAESAAQSASEDADATAADRVATGEDADATADDRIATEGLRDEATAAVNSLGNIVALTQSAYDALDPPDQGVLYVIVPSGVPTALDGIFAFPVEDLPSVEKRPGFLYIGTEAE